MIQTKGTGAPVEKENFVYVRYSNLNFYEEYQQTKEERVAKQIGKYSTATYYGPELWAVDEYSMIEGIYEVMVSMREGDRRRIWIPSWLSSNGYPGSGAQYSSTTIHDVEILKVVADIEKFQIDSLESYRDRYYPGVDSLSWGFYIKTLKEGTGDTLKVGNKAKVWYIGRLLDHFVFDTNIADSAKKHYIFGNREEENYEVIEGECKEDEVFGSPNEEGRLGSMVKGFSKAIFNMRHGEEAVAFFHSGLGYAADGESKAQIQPFAPLVFYIKVERTNFENEEE
jgi:FKBP-type peptidyl-prolyl cis-trans isomerase